MVFSSVEFLFIFLPAILVAYHIFFKSLAWKNLVLLLASVCFYAWGEPVFVFVMLFSIFVNWLLAYIMDQASTPALKKIFLTLAMTYNVSLLIVYKYATFICENINFLFKKDLFSVHIALPIGISFFTFQIMSYVVDVYRKEAKVQKNVLNVALYISMFPQLIAGPIVRYVTVAEEINDRRVLPEEFTRGVFRFVTGLGKKALIANYVGYIADMIFNYAALGEQIAVATAWLGAVMYTIQIYFDFSGYSDMAIGLGLMFGFHFNENFNYPYIARSIQDFWRRWHISLSTWFRDYVYIPIGGNKVSKRRWVVNMFLVWLLTGIWHGANWTFILWGLFYFVLLTFERLTGFDKKLGRFGHIYTLFLVLIGWVLFRSESVALAREYLSVMFGLTGVPLTDELFYHALSNGKFFLCAGVLFSMPVMPTVGKYLSDRSLDLSQSVFMLLIFGLSAAACIQSSYNPFIYFNF